MWKNVRTTSVKFLGFIKIFVVEEFEVVEQQPLPPQQVPQQQTQQQVPQQAPVQPEQPAQAPVPLQSDGIPKPVNIQRETSKLVNTKTETPKPINTQRL